MTNRILVLLFPIIFIILITACSSKTDQSYFNEADNFLKQDNIPDAVSSYENLLKEFPDSKLAPQVLMKLAAIYQSKRVTSLSELESLKKANEYYMMVFEKYPDDAEAPTALFMAGFIQANELNDYDQATKTYNTFLQKYPDNDLAASAKQELENMGLSPEEILRKNLAKQE